MEKKTDKNNCLYKYISLYPKKDNTFILENKDSIKLNEHTMNLLTKGELYFSNPDEFNDPFDCWIPFSQEKPNQEALNSIKNSTIRNIKLEAQNYSETLNFLKARRTIQSKFLSKIRIFCLSKTNNNILMWSHYAQNHEGICVGIKTKKLTKITQSLKLNFGKINKSLQTEESTINGVARKVEYGINNKMLHPFNKNTSIFNRENLKYFYHKSNYWEYEKEYRIFFYHEEMKGNIFLMNINDIKEIYFGFKTPDKVIEETINTLINNNITAYSDIEYYKMFPKEDQYELEPKRLKLYTAVGENRVKFTLYYTKDENGKDLFINPNELLF